MKTKILLCFLAVTLVAAVQSTSAQTPGQYDGGYGGGQVYEPGAFQPVVGDVYSGMPGRIWVAASLADRGLGYQGSYATIGAKGRLCEDFLDGRWLCEARAHTSLNGGGFFGNLGLERVFSIESAGAEVSLGAWVDYDSDQQGDFAHTFGQVGVTAQIKKRLWDLIGNGYFPQGTADYAQGDPTGVNCFLNHSIVLTPGIDSALGGFDITLRSKPKHLGLVNGTCEIGAYGYDSDLIDFFGGGRVGVGMQALSGMIVNAELNYDERFNTTGLVRLGWMFGVNARGNEYAGIGRDLEPTLRNDHIVRFQQDAILALDPDTGRPYNVYHVDNTADAAFADGTAETPFTTLSDAETASDAGDIIFVREGNGTARGMRGGIVLKNDQFFLGDGETHVIPIQDGLGYVLCNDQDGNRPTISGSNNGAAVTLANNNVVAGFNIDGTQSVGGMSHGILGDGIVRGSPITTGTIRDNMITGAILDGVHLDTIAGDWTFSRNEVVENGFDGIRILNACDPRSIFRFVDNTVSENGQDGISLENYDARRLTFLRNITNDNGRDGVRLVNFKDGLGRGLDLDILNHTATGNNGFGINIIGGEGNLRIVNGTVTNNVGGGLNILDWTNTDPGTLTFIGTSGDGASLYTGNSGIGINAEITSGIQRLLITDSTVNANGFGIVARADGVGTDLISRILDNQSISNNLVDGIRIIATGGASHNTLIDEQGDDGVQRLPIQNNGGNGLVFLSGDASIGPASEIEAIVNNMNITGSVAGHGIFGEINENGSIQLMITDSNLDTNAIDGMHFDLNSNENAIVNRILVSNISMLDNGDDGIDINSFAGTFIDLQVIDSVFDSTAAIAANGDNNTVRLGGFGSGIELTQDGDDSLINPQIDGRLRTFIQGNTITEFATHGVGIDATGDGQVLARVDGNFLDQNGFGLGNNGGGLGPPDIVPPTPTIPPFIPTPPFRAFEGMRFQASDTSRIDLRMGQNDINRSTEAGLLLRTADSGIINSVLIENDFSDNDYGNDPDDDPFQNDRGFDFIFDNAGEMCVSMSNNFFSTIPDVGHPITGGFAIRNTNAPADFVLELDGLTNLFGPADVAAPITFAPFGTVCEPAVAAGEAAFLADGFPPIE